MIALLTVLPYVPIVVGASALAALFLAPEQHRGTRRRGVWRWIPC